MSIGVFLILMALGAGAIAFWFDVRFPNLAPSELLPLIVHLAGVTLLAKFVVPATFKLTDDTPLQTLGGIFGVGFPVVIYALVVGLWMLKLLQQTMAGHLR